MSLESVLKEAGISKTTYPDLYEAANRHDFNNSTKNPSYHLKLAKGFVTLTKFGATLETHESLYKALIQNVSQANGLATAFAELNKQGATLPKHPKALHVEDDSGIMHQGVDAFIVIWRKLPRFWPWLAFFISLPIVLPLAKKIYDLFSTWRFKRLGYDKCDL